MDRRDRVRVALMEDIDKLGEIVEVDETFVGGLAKNRHWDKRGGGGGAGGIGSGKTPIVGAVSRKGNVVARVVANVNSATLTAFVREAVSHKVSLLCTDQYPGYNPLDKDYPHATIDHARGQYVVGAIHTQTIEGFWSIFKRGVVGFYMWRLDQHHFKYALPIRRINRPSKPPNNALPKS